MNLKRLGKVLNGRVYITVYLRACMTQKHQGLDEGVKLRNESRNRKYLELEGS